MATKPKRSLFKKGQSNPGSKARRAQTGSGRGKGVKNKFSRDVKTSILNALEVLGGDEFLIKLGKSSKFRTAFVGLVKAIIPAQMIGTPGDPNDQAAKVREKLREMDDSTAVKK